jgi:hypothetical protein
MHQAVLLLWHELPGHGAAILLPTCRLRSTSGLLSLVVLRLPIPDQAAAARFFHQQADAAICIAALEASCCIVISVINKGQTAGTGVYTARPGDKGFCDSRSIVQVSNAAVADGVPVALLLICERFCHVPLA